MSTPPPGRRGRPRRQRSLTASLAQIALSTEFVVVALAALVLFGLHDLKPAIALGGGGALLVLIVIAAGLAGSARPRAARAGVVVGWIVQAVFVAAIVLNVAVGIVGLLFAALWAYSMATGARVDRQRAS